MHHEDLVSGFNPERRAERRNERHRHVEKFDVLEAHGKFHFARRRGSTTLRLSDNDLHAIGAELRDDQVEVGGHVGVWYHNPDRHFGVHRK